MLILCSGDRQQSALTVGPVSNLSRGLCVCVCMCVCLRLDVCHMFGDMSPLCNGPPVIYHSLPSLQRRLDLDENKEYENDLD